MTEHQKRWATAAGVVLAGTLFVYAVLYMDVVLRAKSSFQEAEKYMQWHHDPSKKALYLNNVYEKEKSALDVEKSRGTISVEDYETRAAALEFERNFQLNESSLKYAYQWYKDTYELFSPPESKWVKASRQKAPEALLMWKDELCAQNIPFDDYMFE